MCSQSPVLTHSTTKTLCSGSLTLSNNNNKEHNRSTTPKIAFSSSSSSTASHQKIKLIQMTTGGGINTNSNNNNSTQESTTGQQTLPCHTIPSTSSINTLGKSSTISSTTRHNNASLSSNNVNNNNNSTTAINNNKLNTNNNEGNNNSNSSKLQTLEQRKLELEKLLNEKNWLLQQIHKQEAQILNGSYENFNVFEIGKLSGSIGLTGGGGGSTTTTNSILRRKGSSSLKLPKSNVHFNGKSNRYPLSKSEYDLAQENKHNNNQQSSSANPNIMSIKKRQGPPQKTNSFHDSAPASALGLTKSPSFEYNGNGSGGSGSAHQQSGGNSIKYSVVRPPQHNINNTSSSNENLSDFLGITQCDKYYLSPTSQMYTDGNGFIKASQNIKKCLSSPSPMHKIMSLNDTHQQQQVHMTNGHHCLAHHNNGSQPHLEQYESIDALSLAPSNAFDQNLWRALSNNDRSAWCDNSYIELDSESVNVNQFHSIKPLAKQIIPPPGTSLQHSPEIPSLGNFYPVGGGLVVGSYPNTLEKSCDELSISSVNSETTKKPKNKQWMESSLDGPIIRPHILQTSPSVTDAIALCPALSPTLSQNPLQYAYYNNAARQSATTAINSAIPSGKLTPTPVAAGAGGSGMLLVPVVNSRPPTRTLTHDSHPTQQHHHKQNYRERTKLSSQSMSSGSYRTPKTKLDEENSHLSHSTSYLNVDPYQHHHFQQQQPQIYHHNHYYLEIPIGPFPHQKQIQQQKSPKASPSSTLQQQQQSQPKFSPTIQQSPSALLNDDFVGNIRYATSVATQPSRLCSSSQTLTKNTKPVPPNSLPINTVQQLSPVGAATSPDIRIESPKNMTVVQQATFLPYKEETKPFEMSDFYKYSTKFRQKEANTATISKNSTQN